MTVATNWKPARRAATTLQLDVRNPRFVVADANPSERDLINYLFDHYGAGDVAESISHIGFIPAEPLVCIWEDQNLVVVEGNRRLAALKALQNPQKLDSIQRKRVEKLLKQLPDPDAFKGIRVPILIAPSRRAVDAYLVKRHLKARNVMSWEEFNRSKFITEKLAEGYSEEDLRKEFGLDATDIKEAKFREATTRAAMALDLLPAHKALLAEPNGFPYSTYYRLLDSTPGREFLKLSSDKNAGFTIQTAPGEFQQALKRIVVDIIEGKIDSRSLSSNAGISTYLSQLGAGLEPKQSNTALDSSSVMPPPSDFTASSTSPTAAKTGPKKGKSLNQYAIPKNFKAAHGSDRLLLVLKELQRLNRNDQRFASAVLMRVFLELSIVEFLSREGKLQPLVDHLKKVSKGRVSMPFDIPPMKELINEVKKIAGPRLTKSEMRGVSKALQYHDAAWFNISELNGFVHGQDVPTGNDVHQFWDRAEPLFRLMLH